MATRKPFIDLSPKPYDHRAPWQPTLVATVIVERTQPNQTPARHRLSDFSRFAGIIACDLPAYGKGPSGQFAAFYTHQFTGIFPN